MDIGFDSEIYIYMYRDLGIMYLMAFFYAKVIENAINQLSMKNTGYRSIIYTNLLIQFKAKRH